MTEIDFWEAKMMNLESIFEQMKCDTTKHMASILQITDRYLFRSENDGNLKRKTKILKANIDLWFSNDIYLFSAYYPCFRSMFRNVVTALNEAQDITLYLKPLKQHFKVSSLVTYYFLNVICYSSGSISLNDCYHYYFRTLIKTNSQTSFLYCAQWCIV